MAPVSERAPDLTRAGLLTPRRRAPHYLHRGVERTLAWLLGCRRLGTHYERRADWLLGLLQLACALICLHFLRPVELL